MELVGDYSISVFGLMVLTFALPSPQVKGTSSLGVGANRSSSSTTRNILYINAYCSGENFDGGGTLFPIEEAVNSSERLSISAVNIESAVKVSQTILYETCI